MSFCGRCSKDVWFPCKNLQSELSCRHKRESSGSDTDVLDVDVDTPKSSGGFFSAIGDFLGDIGGGFDGGGGCDGGGCGAGD